MGKRRSIRLRIINLLRIYDGTGKKLPVLFLGDDQRE